MSRDGSVIPIVIFFAWKGQFSLWYKWETFALAATLLGLWEENRLTGRKSPSTNRIVRESLLEKWTFLPCSCSAVFFFLCPLFSVSIGKLWSWINSAQLLFPNSSHSFSEVIPCTSNTFREYFLGYVLRLEASASRVFIFVGGEWERILFPAM